MARVEIPMFIGTPIELEGGLWTRVPGFAPKGSRFGHIGESSTAEPKAEAAVETPSVQPTEPVEPVVTTVPAPKV